VPDHFAVRPIGTRRDNARRRRPHAVRGDQGAAGVPGLPLPEVPGAHCAPRHNDRDQYSPAAEGIVLTTSKVDR
jgi:hypothetical protein